MHKKVFAPQYTMSGVAISTLIQGGFVWLATQAWADLGKKTINKYYPGNREGVIATLIYCVIVTIAIFIVIWSIHRVAAVDYKAKYNAAAAQLAIMRAAQPPAGTVQPSVLLGITPANN